MVGPAWARSSSAPARSSEPAVSSASAAASSRVARRRSSTDSSAARDRNVAVAAYPPRSRARRARVRALSRLLQPCRHCVIKPARSHPQNATRPDPDAGPRYPQPPAPDESGVVARAGCCGTRRSPAWGRDTTCGPDSTRSRGPGSSLTLSATGDPAATSEPDQVEVLDDGSAAIVGAVAGRTEDHARERTARRRQSMSRRVASRMYPPGSYPSTRLTRGHGK